VVLVTPSGLQGSRGRARGRAPTTVMSSPAARLRRAHGGVVPISGGGWKDPEPNGLSMWTMQGTPVGVNEILASRRWSSKTSLSGSSPTAALEPVASAAVEVDDKAVGQGPPPVIRHNRCFLVPDGLDEGKGWMPTRAGGPGDYRYHDMVMKTIYMKSSKDLDALGKHVLAMQQARQDSEGSERLPSRFQRQRDTAALWQDMRPTFDQIMGRESRASPAAAHDDEAPRPLASRPEPASASTDIDNSLRVEKSQATQSLGEHGRVASAPSLTPGRERSRTSAAVGGSRKPVWPLKPSTPGTRGLPREWVPARCVNGIMMFPNDRSLTLNGARQHEETMKGRCAHC